MRTSAKRRTLRRTTTTAGSGGVPTSGGTLPTSTHQGTAKATERLRREGTWTISATVRTSISEIDQLETSYDNRLAPLVPHAQDKQRHTDRLLGASPRRRLQPEPGAGRRSDRQVPFEAPGRSVYRTPSCSEPWAGAGCSQKQSGSVVRSNASPPRTGGGASGRTDWAEFCSQRGDYSGCEVAYREHASRAPNDTFS